MALWPNNRRNASAGPYRFLGVPGFYRYVPKAGQSLAMHTVLAQTASNPEGAAPRGAFVWPRKAGGMAAQGVEETLTGSSALKSGGAMESSSVWLTMTPTGDVSLFISLSGGGTLEFTVPDALLTTVSALSGTFLFELTPDGNLSIINPMSGAFVCSFTTDSNLKGNLSMFGNFNNSGAFDPEYADAAVHVAPWGIDGSTYPSGTATQPVLTMGAAWSIASRYNLHEIHFTGEHTLTRDFSNFTFRGSGPTAFNSIDLNNQALDRVRFIDCSLTGQVNATSVAGSGWQTTKASVSFLGCSLFEMIDLEGNSDKCQIEGSTSIKAGGWFSATELVVEGDFTVFDMRDVAFTTLSADIASGWTRVINLGTDCLIELNVKGGEVSFDATCDGGSYYLEGTGTLFNDGVNLIKKENHFVWDEPRSYHTELESTGETLIDLDREVDELHKLQGLNVSHPMTVSDTERTVDDITLDITTGGGGETVVTRQP
jgi:hypothetical protein